MPTAPKRQISPNLGPMEPRLWPYRQPNVHCSADLVYDYAWNARIAQLVEQLICRNCNFDQ